MKFIASRELRNRPGKVWKELREEGELIVTSNGQPVALMVPLESDNVEEMVRAFRRARAQEAVRDIRGRWAKKGYELTRKEIDEEIQQVRKQRRALGR